MNEEIKPIEDIICDFKSDNATKRALALYELKNHSEIDTETILAVAKLFNDTATFTPDQSVTAKLSLVYLAPSISEIAKVITKFHIAKVAPESICQIFKEIARLEGDERKLAINVICAVDDEIKNVINRAMIDDDDLVCILGTILKDGDFPYQSSYKRLTDALASIGEKAIPALENALENPKTSLIAIESLGEIGEASIKILIKALKSDVKDVRLKAADSLCKIGIASEDVINALRDAEKKEKGWLARRRFTKSLKKLL